MTRRIVTLSACALCLMLVALAVGCGRQQPQQAQPPLAQSTRAAMPLTRGENFFDKGETKYFPVRFIDEDAVTILDKWSPEVAEGEEQDASQGDGVPAGDVSYYIGEERFDTVVALINHLDDLDEETLAHGLVLIQQVEGDGRPDWQQDITQLCIFAEFKNINLWFRVPAEAADPETEHAYWLVRHTDPQVSSHERDTVDVR